MNDASTGWKIISAFLDDTVRGERVGVLAAGLAQRFGAHLIAIHSIEGVPNEYGADAFARGKDAVDAVVVRHRAAEQARTRAIEHRLADLAAAHHISTEVRVIRWGNGEEEVLANSLHCDVVILGHPKAHGLSDWWTGRRLLMASGVPILVIPDGWEGETIGRRVLVAWNASREARRAAGDAMPLLRTADRVTVLVVDAEREPGKFSEEPGADAAIALARHGAHVDLRQVGSAGASVAEVIVSQAVDLDADLVVIGASCRGELFGSTTRALLDRSPVPALVSR